MIFSTESYNCLNRKLANVRHGQTRVEQIISSHDLRLRSFNLKTKINQQATVITSGKMKSVRVRGKVLQQFNCGQIHSSPQPQFQILREFLCTSAQPVVQAYPVSGSEF